MTFDGSGGDDLLQLGTGITGSVIIESVDNVYTIKSSGDESKIFYAKNINEFESTANASLIFEYATVSSGSTSFNFDKESGSYTIGDLKFTGFSGSTITLTDSYSARASNVYAFSGGDATFTSPLTLNVSSLTLGNVLFSGSDDAEFIINGLNSGATNTNEIKFAGTTANSAVTVRGNDTAADIIDLGKLAVPSESLIAIGGSGAGDIISFELTSKASYTLVSGGGDGADTNFDKWGYSGNEANNYMQGFETINITGSGGCDITLDASGAKTTIDRNLAFNKYGSGGLTATFGGVTTSGGSLTIDLSGSSSENTLTFGAVSLSGGNGINLTGGTGNDKFTFSTISGNASDKIDVTLTGGLGNDTYSFSSGSTDTINVIETYHSGGTIDKNTIKVTNFGATSINAALIEGFTFTKNDDNSLTIGFGTGNPTLKFSLTDYDGVDVSGGAFIDVLELYSGDGSAASAEASINLADIYKDQSSFKATIGNDAVTITPTSTNQVTP